MAASVSGEPHRASDELHNDIPNAPSGCCGKRKTYLGLMVVLMAIPFCVSNLLFAFRSTAAWTSSGISDTELDMHQSHAASEMKTMLDDSKKQVADLQNQLQRMQAVATKADHLASELEKAKADISDREEHVKTVEEELSKLKDEMKIAKRKKTRDDPRPNILLLYADDWRYDTLGIANAVVKTPHLDQLAREGIRFTENCVTTSVCWASRATLLTGLYLARHKTDRPQVWHGNWTESIYYLLMQAGYYVGHVGKWGIWDLPERNLDFETDDEGWHYETLGDRLWHITEKNEHDALQFLRTRNKKKPFFLNVAFYATHAVDGDPKQYLPQNSSMSLYVNDTIPVPITATTEEWQKMPYFFSDGNEGRVRWSYRYKTPELHQHMMKNYYRMATEVDSACGSIIQKLKKQGELDNTIIIFTTDNGNFHAEHGLADKWYPHQESIRVPLIIRDPRMAASKAGTLNDDFTLNLDLAPTILSAAGVKPLKTMMGRDMSDLYLKKDVKWRQEFYYEHPFHVEKSYIPGSEALVRKGYKYFLWSDFKFEQFFDLKNDPMEQHDMINSTDATHQRILTEMKRQFRKLRAIVHSNKTVTL